LATTNQPEAVESFIQHAIAAETTDPIRLVHLCQASLIKTAPLCGFPKIINAMNSLVDGLPRPIYHQLRSSYEKPSPMTTEAYRTRGMILFDRVYGVNSQRVQDRIGESSPRLMDIIMNDMYGKILSDESLLSAPQTELLAVGALATQDVPYQLRSHVLGARNVGVPQVQIDAVITLAKLLLRRRRASI
ncbi:hypothetical protein BJ684DRAFT_10107, partial [Piptocephalis cylindrospora]